MLDCKFSLRDRLIVDPAHDKFGDLLAFPLRRHVTGAVDRGEVQPALVADEEAGDLAVGVPGGPGLLDGPVQLLDPPAGAIGRHGSVRISRVEEHLVAILGQHLVDPVGALVLVGVVLVDLIVALLPGLHVVRNVQRTTHVLAVCVV